MSTVTAEPTASARPLPEYATLVTVFGARAVADFMDAAFVRVRRGS